MTQLLVKIAAKFNTTLNLKTAIWATSATLDSATDDSGVALPTGRYALTIDWGTAAEEFITCTLTSTALTNIKHVTMQGVESSGTTILHRKGATVKITDFAVIKKMLDVLDWTTNFDASTPLGYDGTATISTANQFATKAYVDGVAIAGGADASTTVKGITKMSVAPASAANPIAVGDNDGRVPTQDENDALAGAGGSPSSSNLYETQYDTSNGATKTATTISFTSGTKTIADSGNGFVTAGFKQGTQITITGSASNNGTFTIVSVAAGAIVVAENIVTEAAWSSDTIATVRADKLVRADSTGKLPAYDGSRLTNLNIPTVNNFPNFVIKFPVENATYIDTFIGSNQLQENPDFIYTAYSTTATNTRIHRYDRQTNGSYVYKGVIANITVASGSCVWITVIWSFVYVWQHDGGAGGIRVYRLALDLTGSTLMTGTMTMTNSTNRTCMTGDGTDLFFTDYSGWFAVNAVKRWTISGTTLSFGSTITLSVAGSINSHYLYKFPSGGIYIIDRQATVSSISYWNNSGTAQTAITCLLSTYTANIEQPMWFFKYAGTACFSRMQKLDGTNSSNMYFQSIDLI